MKRSAILRAVESLLEQEGTSFEKLARPIVESGGSADDVMFEIRQRTAVPVTTRTVQRWIDQLVGNAA